MPILDTSFPDRCIQTLEKAYHLLIETNPDEIDYDLYRSVCIKEFQIITELSGKLLRKVLKPYFHSPKVADKLYYNDIFREAVLKDLISLEACERWLKYRDNRNTTAHDYGVKFAEETLVLLPDFIADATSLSAIIKYQFKNYDAAAGEGQE